MCTEPVWVCHLCIQQVIYRYPLAEWSQLLYTRVRYKQPSGDSFLLIVRSLLCRGSDPLRPEPIRFSRMGHGQNVRTRDTVVGGGVASNFRARGSQMASSTWSNLLIILVFTLLPVQVACFRVREPVLMFPSYKNDICIYIYISTLGVSLPPGPDGTNPFHNLNQWWQILFADLWHFLGNSQDIFSMYEFEYYLFKITAPSPMDKWVNGQLTFSYGIGRVGLSP